MALIRLMPCRQNGEKLGLQDRSWPEQGKLMNQTENLSKNI